MFTYLSCSNSLRCFNLFKGAGPSYCVLKFGNNFLSRKRDKTQNVILQVCYLERSSSSIKVKMFLLASTPSSIYKYTCKVSSRSYFSFTGMVEQSLTVKCRRMKDRRNYRTCARIARFRDRSLIATFCSLRRYTVDTVDWQVANKIGLPIILY